MQVDCSVRATALALVIVSASVTWSLCSAAPATLPAAMDMFTDLVQRLGISAEAIKAPTAESERHSYAMLLAGGPYDWVIPPFRVQRAGVDVAQRSIMAAYLSRALAERGLTVADPNLVARAFGEDRALSETPTFYGLTKQLDARNLLIGYVGHDEHGHLVLTLSVERQPGSAVAPNALMTWKDVDFSDEMPPALAIRARLPEILQALGVHGSGHATVSVGASKFQLPISPTGLVGAPRGDPLDSAIRLAILGALAPPNTRGADRLFEQALTSVPDTPASQDAAFVRAYALFRLNLRPAALRAIANSRTPGANALREIVNGNATGMAAIVHRSAGYQRLILEIELHDLVVNYNRNDRQPMPVTLAKLAERDPSWDALLSGRWEVGNPWATRSNLELKVVLDRAYPISGIALADIAASGDATPGQTPQWTDVELSVYNHVRRLLADSSKLWCCGAELDGRGSVTVRSCGVGRIRWGDLKHSYQGGPSWPDRRLQPSQTTPSRWRCYACAGGGAFQFHQGAGSRNSASSRRRER